MVVIGGGPIGCALAAALGRRGIDTLLLEARAQPAAASDARTLALSWGTRLILQRLGAWEALQAPTAILSIHVSQRAAFGRTELHAEEVGLPALGYVVAYSDLHRSLLEQARLAGVQVREGSTALDIDAGSDCTRVSIDAAAPVSGRLAVVADGGASLAKAAGTRVASVDYRQCAVVGLVRTAQPPRNRAYERFTGEGPVALLPHGDEYALVWSCTPAVAPLLTALDDDGFIARLQNHFGDRAGRFLAVRDRTSFPLVLRFAWNTVMHRTILVGNAAQALHPIAGQGFNLGLRDAWDLCEILGADPTADPGDPALLSRYRRARRGDRIAGIALTDALTRLFSNDFTPLACARGIAVASLDLFPPAKHSLMRRMIFGTHW